MLRTALGPAIARYLEDAGIVEVMLNPDGRLWIDRLSEGLADTGERLSPEDGERIIRLVAHHVGVEVHQRAPRVSAELPETGERFEGLLPPVVTAPVFAIRKPAVAVFTLDDYVAAGIMDAGQAAALRVAVAERRNVLVAGGTSTGKTTLTNALLHEIAQGTDRVVIIEDTRELQCRSANHVAMRTKDGIATLSDLVRSSLRLRPDRIPIGEVRGAEALDLLKAWSTGHPGGVGTIHAGSAIGALRRLEQLIQEAVVTVPRPLIAETIDLIAVLSGRGTARRLAELAVVEGFGPDGDYRLSPLAIKIVESCPTRFLLPNDHAIEPQITKIYRRFGLNDREIEIVARSTPKRDYYCRSSKGNRLFELGLGPIGLALTAASARTDQPEIARIHAEHGRAGFLAAWLRHRGVDWAADLIPELPNLIDQPDVETASDQPVEEKEPDQ